MGIIFCIEICIKGLSKNNTGKTVYSYWSKAFLADFHGILKVCALAYICLSFKNVENIFDKCWLRQKALPSEQRAEEQSQAIPK